MPEHGAIGPVRVPPRIEDEIEYTAAAREAWQLYTELCVLAERRGWLSLQRVLERHVEPLLPEVDEQEEAVMNVPHEAILRAFLMGAPMEAINVLLGWAADIEGAIRAELNRIAQEHSGNGARRTARKPAPAKPVRRTHRAAKRKSTLPEQQVAVASSIDDLLAAGMPGLDDTPLDIAFERLRARLGPPITGRINPVELMRELREE